MKIFNKKKIKLFFDYMKSRPKRFSVRLSENEKEFFLRHIKDAKNYLEFGTGGSTFLTLLNSKADIVGVESDNNWLNYLRKWILIRKNERSGRLKLVHIDIGKTKGWGVPVDDSEKDKWPNYSSEIFKIIDAGKIDMVLVDGRFRVACALSTIIHCNEDAKIIIHDFNDRPEYHVLLDYLEITDSADTFAAFKVKKLAMGGLQQELERYAYDYR